MKVTEDGSLRFVSGAVLFPQRWSLAEKLGMDMRQVPRLAHCSFAGRCHIRAPCPQETQSLPCHEC